MVICTECDKPISGRGRKYCSGFCSLAVEARRKAPKSCRIRAEKFGLTEHFTEDEWVALCQFYTYKCLKCRKETKFLAPDHVIPLSKGGVNLITNIQPLCYKCNNKKADKTIDYRPA